MCSAAKKPTILITGIGEVGSHLLEFLARDNSHVNIVAADTNLKYVEAKVNNALFGAVLHNRFPDVKAIEIDLFDIERTASILDEIQPDVVINCAVLQTWHVIRRLPDDVYSRLSSATLGAWLPVQLTLAMKLAEAIKLSGISIHYINTSLSDLTNPVLGTMGIAPTIGIGNVTLIELAVRSFIARRVKTSIQNVEIKLVAHHVHWVTWREAGYREGAPFFMKIVVDGKDVTDQFNTQEVMKEAILLYPEGTSFSAVSASSTMQNLMALLSEEPVSLHSPSPDGLPGGYPVILSSAGAKVDLPDDISLEQAVDLNKQAQTFDGIKQVDEDGRVHFMPYTIEIMKNILGFECSSFIPQECEELAKEQMLRFQELEQRYNT